MQPFPKFTTLELSVLLISLAIILLLTLYQLFIKLSILLSNSAITSSTDFILPLEAHLNVVKFFKSCNFLQVIDSQMKISLHPIRRMNALLRGIKVKGASWMENQPLICFLTGFSCLGLPNGRSTLALPTPKNIRSNDPVLLTRARSEVIMDSYPSTASSLLSELAPPGIWRPLPGLWMLEPGHGDLGIVEIMSRPWGN